MEQKKQAVLADIALLLVAAIWGLGFLAGAGAIQSFPPFRVLAFRFGGAAILMFCFFHKHILKTEKEKIKKGLLLGIVQFIGLSLQLTALRYTTPGKQAFLVTSYVAFVPFISWVMIKKKPTVKAVLAGLVTLTGVGLLSINESFTIGLGDSLSIVFAIIFGLQIVITGLFAKDINPFALAFFQFLSAGFLACMVSIAVGDTMPVHPSWYSVGSVIYLIVANTVIAFTVQNIAQKYVSDTHTSVIISTESVFGILFSALLLGERMKLRGAVGCVLIFGAVMLSKLDWKEVWRKRKTATDKSMTVSDE